MFKGYPQPWRTWLLILTALIVALFIVQIVTSTGWVLIMVLFALIAIQFALARYARICRRRTWKSFELSRRAGAAAK